MPFEILAHVEKIANHGEALQRVVHAWEACFGIPLYWFSTKGPGQKVDDEFLKSRSGFGRLDDQICLTLKESRRRSACKLEIWFTNPARAFYGDLNFISAVFPDQWLDQFGPEKAELAIVKFFLSLDGIGILLDATFEHQDVALQSPGIEIFQAVKTAYDCNLGHIAFLNPRFRDTYGGFAALTRAGFKVHVNWALGCIASIPLNFHPSTTEAAWSLFDALERVGVFTRTSEPTFLEQDRVCFENIGGFLGAFEEQFGRVFGARYSDGLRPAEST